MSSPVVSWHGRSELRADAVRLLQSIAAVGGVLQRGQVPADGSPGGGLHVSLCAQRLARERRVPLSVILDSRGQISWLDQSERYWGIARATGGMMDRCFERLPASEAGAFAVTIVAAIPAGRDLNPVSTQWMLELLSDNAHGLHRYTPAGSSQRSSVAEVTALFRREATGDRPTVEQWTRAAKAAAAAGELADAVDPSGAPAYAAGAANVAAAAFAPELIPAQVRVGALRLAATLPDEAAAAAFQTAYLRTEAFAQAAEYACEAVHAAADTTFQSVLAVDGAAAERARAAEQDGRPVAATDAAAIARVRAAADAAADECVAYYRWRAGRLLALLSAN
jgi:hypothetical protein